MIETISDNLDVQVESNWLTVEGIPLRANVLKNSKSDNLTVSANELQRIIHAGRFTILSSIESFYEKTKSANPNLTVVRPSIFTAHLGTTRQTDGASRQVFTDKGYKNGGINKSKDEINSKFGGYWDADMQNGFVPEVRRTSGTYNGGSWLLIRKPTLLDVSEQWLGYHQIDTQHKQITAALAPDAHLSMEDKTYFLRMHRLIGEAAITAAEKSLTQESYTRQQLGLNLASLSLKQAMGIDNGFDQDIDDVLDYAHNSDYISESTVLAIENSQY